LDGLTDHDPRVPLDDVEHCNAIRLIRELLLLGKNPVDDVEDARFENRLGFAVENSESDYRRRCLVLERDDREPVEGRQVLVQVLALDGQERSGLDLAFQVNVGVAVTQEVFEQPGRRLDGVEPSQQLGQVIDEIGLDLGHCFVFGHQHDDPSLSCIQRSRGTLHETIWDDFHVGSYANILL